MQVMLTNRSSVQYPVLITKAGRWYAFMLMPGIEQTITGDDVTNIRLGKQLPGTAPADSDSMKAKDTYVAGIFVMEGRSDIAAATQITPLRLFVENFEGTLDVNDGEASIGTLAKGERKEVTATQFMLTVS